MPFDWPMLFDCLEKTRRLVVYDDTNRFCGLAAEIVSSAAEQVDLLAKPRRVTRADVTVPFAVDLEISLLPSRAKLLDAIRASMKDIAHV